MGDRTYLICGLTVQECREEAQKRKLAFNEYITAVNIDQTRGLSGMRVILTPRLKAQYELCMHAFMTQMRETGEPAEEKNKYEIRNVLKQDEEVQLIETLSKLKKAGIKTMNTSMGTINLEV